MIIISEILESIFTQPVIVTSFFIQKPSCKNIMFEKHKMQITFFTSQKYSMTKLMCYHRAYGPILSFPVVCVEAGFMGENKMKKTYKGASEENMAVPPALMYRGFKAKW